MNQDPNTPPLVIHTLGREPQADQEPAQVLARIFRFPTIVPTAADLRAALDQESAASIERRTAYDKLPKRAPRDNASAKALADRSHRETHFFAAKAAHEAASTTLREMTLAHARAHFAPMLRPFIRAAVEALPVQKWVRVGERTLRSVLRVDVDGGMAGFDILAVFDKMGLLAEVSVYRLTETGMERERSAWMDPATYLASKRHPSCWDLIWQLRSGDRLSDDHRSWSMDTRTGFGLTPTDAQVLARMGEKMSALLGTLQALKMPNIALLDMAASDLAEIGAGILAPDAGEYMGRLEQAFPAAREARTQASQDAPTPQEAHTTETP